MFSLTRRVSIRPAQAVSILVLLVLPIALMIYKVHRGGYDLQTLVPVETYSVALSMSLEGHGDTVRVRTFLPQSDARVTIQNERLHSDLPAFWERCGDVNRVAEWSGPDVTGPRVIRAEYTAFARPLTYDIDRAILVPEGGVAWDTPFLHATEAVQADDPEIAELAEQLAPSGEPLVDGLGAIHEYCQAIDLVSFKGTTDARTALRLGEASCNGKSRLFVALARSRGIPARLVGGLILGNATKRTSHQWVEVLIGPHWVPFCPTNDYVATAPASYLPLYWGDMSLFTHTKDTNFDYVFRMERQLGIRAELVEQGARDPLNLMNIWGTFEQAGIPIQLLRIMLMIPLGALVLVILRNVVGLQTFGTFLPVLIAIAAREIGLTCGLLVFFLLVALVYCVRLLIARLNLLHLPQMAILLTSSVLFMLVLGVIGVRAGHITLSHVSMYPMAILAITTERFALMIEEEGIGATVKIAVMTAAAIAGCYAVMNARTFQILFMTFPELVLVVVFFDVWMGHWIGLRVLEHWRFRRLLGQSQGGGRA